MGLGSQAGALLQQLPILRLRQGFEPFGQAVDVIGQGIQSAVAGRQSGGKIALPDARGPGGDAANGLHQRPAVDDIKRDHQARQHHGGQELNAPGQCPADCPLPDEPAGRQVAQ